LVIGGTGLIGSALCQEFVESGIQAVALSRRIKKASFEVAQADLMTGESLGDVACRFQPTWIVHAAGFPGGVSACEKRPKDAQNFFLKGTRRAVQVAKNSGAGLVLISTDAVFSSSKQLVHEEMPTNPSSTYGQLKLASEEIVRAAGVPHLIIRTSNVYGWDPKSATPNFLMQVLRSVQAGRLLQVSSILRATPTWAGDLAKAIAGLIVAGAEGIFHVVGEESLSREEWARNFLHVMNLPQTGILGSADSGMIGGRPILRLDSRKVRKTIGWKNLSLKQGHELLKKEYESSEQIGDQTLPQNQKTSFRSP